MKMKLYAVNDTKGSMTPPIAHPTHGLAERWFQDVINDPKTEPAKHPQDFDLYYLGQFDPTSGKIEALDTPEHIIKAINLIGPKN